MNFIERLFDRLIGDISHLNGLLHEINDINVTISTIPPVIKGQELAPIEIIMPQHYGGKEAIAVAGEALSDLFIRNEYSQKCSRRYVGLVQIGSERTTDIRNLLHAINRNKKLIEKYVIDNFSKRQERFRVIHESCPGVMTLHLYRKIHVLENLDIQSVKFYWLRKDSLYIPDKKSLLLSLSDELEKGGRDNHIAINQLIKRVASTPDKLLRIRRPIPVQPVANVLVEGKAKTMTAPLPIFTFQDKPIDTQHISSFVASVERKKRSDKKNSLILGTVSGQYIERISK